MRRGLQLGASVVVLLTGCSTSGNGNTQSDADACNATLADIRSVTAVVPLEPRPLDSTERATIATAQRDVTTQAGRADDAVTKAAIRKIGLDLSSLPHLQQNALLNRLHAMLPDIDALNTACHIK